MCVCVLLVQGRGLWAYLAGMVFLEKGARRETRGHRASRYLDPPVGLDNRARLVFVGPQDPQEKPLVLITASQETQGCLGYRVNVASPVNWGRKVSIVPQSSYYILKLLAYFTSIP